VTKIHTFLLAVKFWFQGDPWNKSLAVAKAIVERWKIY
jgi:hypothetical protein